MSPLLFTLSAADGLPERLCAERGFESGEVETRQFPDGESYVRLRSPVAGRDVILLCSLDRPDGKTLKLLFAAAAARAQGARSVGLIAPYLAYMRQDRVFHEGEALTSVTYARLLSSAVDWLVTVDPHLHRHPNLSAIYAIPSAAVSAAGPIAEWIGREVPKPFLIGPDEESAQWVGEIAGRAGAPFALLRKMRSGDYDVSLDGSDTDLGERTPVIVDDIVSSARTMAAAVRFLRAKGAAMPVCIAVHAVFSDDALQHLQEAGPARIVTTDTIGHATNAIEIAAQVRAGAVSLLESLR
jgi:ribose-phosphate pyrophosphokinase